MTIVLRALAFLFLVAIAAPATGGAFLPPPGQGQFIAGVGYSAGSRTFDGSGTAVPSAPYRKANIGGYLEYGLTPILAFVAAPTLARTSGFAANTTTGSDSSALGARMLLYGTADRVVSLQALVQPPVGRESLAAALADGGARIFAADIRAMFAQTFLLFARPAFVDVAPGVRIGAAPYPTEARLDVTLGVRVAPSWLLLAQTFCAVSQARPPAIARQAYSKAQVSIVYDLSSRWSIQGGGFRTIAGRNIVRETGPFGAVWYRF